jgi:hypothetical protein
MRRTLFVLALFAPLAIAADAYRIRAHETEVLRSHGTAFAYGDFLITANHTVEDAKSVEVEIDGAWRSARLVYRDTNADIAFLKVSDPKLKQLKRAKDVASGDALRIPASNAAEKIQECDGEIEKPRWMIGSFLTLIAAPKIERGASGAPALKDGKLAGMVICILKLNDRRVGCLMVPLEVIDEHLERARKAKD